MKAFGLQWEPARWLTFDYSGSPIDHAELVESCSHRKDSSANSENLLKGVEATTVILGSWNLTENRGRPRIAISIELADKRELYASRDTVLSFEPHRIPTAYALWSRSGFLVVTAWQFGSRTHFRDRPYNPVDSEHFRQYNVRLLYHRFALLRNGI